MPNAQHNDKKHLTTNRSLSHKAPKSLESHSTDGWQQHTDEINTKDKKQKERHPLPHSHPYEHSMKDNGHYNNIQTVHKTPTNIRIHSVAA